jgi:ribose transport system substrate-binding protein
MSRKLVCVLALALVALMAVPGAFAQKKNPYGAPPWTIGMSQDTMDHPWRAYMVTSAVTEAKKYPDLIKNFIYTDGKGTNEKQIADIEDLISRKVNLIIMSPREAQGLVPAVAAIKKAGIPLVVLDREVVGEDYNVFIGGDNLVIGKGLGEYAVKKLGKKWNFLEIDGIPGATPTIQRREGFHTVIEKFPGIKQLDHQPANYDLAPALPIVEDWKTRFKGQFTAIYSHNDPMALGAIQVLKAAGYKPGDVFLIGIDGQREAFQAIKEGWLQATAIYPTGGAEGVRVALKLLKGEPVPRRIVAECPIVTADNVDQYYDPKLQYVR